MVRRRMGRLIGSVEPSGGRRRGDADRIVQGQKTTGIKWGQTVLILGVGVSLTLLSGLIKRDKDHHGQIASLRQYPPQATGLESDQKRPWIRDAACATVVGGSLMYGTHKLHEYLIDELKGIPLATAPEQPPEPLIFPTSNGRTAPPSPSPDTL